MVMATALNLVETSISRAPGPAGLAAARDPEPCPPPPGRDPVARRVFEPAELVYPQIDHLVCELPRHCSTV